MSSAGVAPTTTQSRSPTGAAEQIGHEPRRLPSTLASTHVNRESQAPDGSRCCWPAQAVLPGCGSLYLLQAARGQAQILVDRRPIQAVVADPKTPPTLRETLAEVSAARDFATRELGLPDNRSYRLYADIGRPYVVWNVVAAPEFSVQSQGVVLSDRRLRHLPRLFPPEIRPGLCREAG